MAFIKVTWFSVEMSGLLELWICGSVYPVLWILDYGALVVDPGLLPLILIVSSNEDEL